MNKIFKIMTYLVLVAALFVFVGCENKLDIDKENGASLNAGRYELNVTSNTEGLSLSLTDEEYKKMIESGEEMIYVPALLASAHETFTKLDDITTPSLWYTAASISKDQSAMDPNTMKHFSTYEEVFEGSSNLRYAFKYDFIINVSEEIGDVKLSVEEVVLPENNIVSIIFVGPDGFQERESDGDIVSPGVLARNIKAGTSEKLTIIMYVNGNDENCTTDKIYKYSMGSSKFDIKIKAEKVED